MFWKFLKDQSGQDLVEYSLLLVLVGFVAVVVLTAMGQSVGSIFSKINVRLADVDGAIDAN